MGDSKIKQSHVMWKLLRFEVLRLVSCFLGFCFSLFLCLVDCVDGVGSEAAVAGWGQVSAGARNIILTHKMLCDARCVPWCILCNGSTSNWM